MFRREPVILLLIYYSPLTYKNIQVNDPYRLLIKDIFIEGGIGMVCSQLSKEARRVLGQYGAGKISIEGVKPHLTHLKDHQEEVNHFLSDLDAPDAADKLAELNKLIQNDSFIERTLPEDYITMPWRMLGGDYGSEWKQINVKSFDAPSDERYCVAVFKNPDENADPKYLANFSLCERTIYSTSWPYGVAGGEAYAGKPIGADTESEAMRLAIEAMKERDAEIIAMRNDPEKMTIQIEPGDRTADIRNKFSQLLENSRKAYPSSYLTMELFTVEYEKPMTVLGRGGKYSEPSTRHELRLFIASDGMLCNAIGSRRGYRIPTNGLKSISVVPPLPFSEKKRIFMESVEKAKRMIPDGVWTSLKKILEERPESLLGGYPPGAYEFKFMHLSSAIGKHAYKYIKPRLEEAFREKKPFSWYMDGTKRDKSISCQVGDDGEFRAYYNSEYHGMLNGDYYLLLNPTTVMYAERD